MDLRDRGGGAYTCNLSSRRQKKQNQKFSQPELYTARPVCLSVLKGWRDDSLLVESRCWYCSCGCPEFSSQHSYQVTHDCLAPAPRGSDDPLPARLTFELPIGQRHRFYTFVLETTELVPPSRRRHSRPPPAGLPGSHLWNAQWTPAPASWLSQMFFWPALLLGACSFPYANTFRNWWLPYCNILWKKMTEDI